MGKVLLDNIVCVGALHLPARRSCQNTHSLLRETHDHSTHRAAFQTEFQSVQDCLFLQSGVGASKYLDPATRFSCKMLFELGASPEVNI
jgi:hypothetical protein